MLLWQHRGRGRHTRYAWRLVVRGAFPEKAAFNQNPTESGAVCQVYQVGYREKACTPKNRYLKLHGFFKQSEQNRGRERFILRSWLP